jgi:hypothetical protein
MQATQLLCPLNLIGRGGRPCLEVIAMTMQALAFAFGAFFLLICIVGGGFEIKEVKIPRVSRVVRGTAGIIGTIFLAIAVGTQQDSDRRFAELDKKIYDMERSGIILRKKAEDEENAKEAFKKKAAEAEEARIIEKQKTEAAERARRNEQNAAVKEKEQMSELLRGAKAAQEIAERKRSEAEADKRAAEQRVNEAKEAAVAAEKDFHQKSVVASTAAKVSKADIDVINRFKTKINRDIYGEDIQLPDGKIGFPAPNITSCADRCNTSESCVAFAFDSWNKQCYQKSKITISIISPRSIIAVKNKFELPKPSTQHPQIKIRHDKRFSGNPIARDSVYDFEECKTLCENDIKCVAFSFLKANERAANCERFNQSEDGYFSESSVDSGWKQQSP